MTKNSFKKLILPTPPFNEKELLQGVWVCLIHAKRTPPHIGLCISGQYCSLNIKGIELNIPIQTILKSIQLKKIECLFLKIKENSNYSILALNSGFTDSLHQFPIIKNTEVTCLTPIKHFFHKFYGIEYDKNDIIFTFLNKLNNNNFILGAYSLNLSVQNNEVEIPVYTAEELNNNLKEIKKEQKKPDVY